MIRRRAPVYEVVAEDEFLAGMDLTKHADLGAGRGKEQRRGTDSRAASGADVASSFEPSADRPGKGRLLVAAVTVLVGGTVWELSAGSRQSSRLSASGTSTRGSEARRTIGSNTQRSKHPSRGLRRESNVVRRLPVPGTLIRDRLQVGRSARRQVPPANRRAIAVAPSLGSVTARAEQRLYVSPTALSNSGRVEQEFGFER
jgi:hypothetical protein